MKNVVEIENPREIGEKTMSNPRQVAPQLPVPLSRFREIPDAEFDVEGINPDLELKPFQKVGAAAAVLVPRMILADRMGLGKTVQTIAALKKLRELARAGLALIVCPGQVIYQWIEEAELWFPGLFKIMMIEGDRAKRYKQYDVVLRNLGHPLNGYDTVLLTYPTLRVDIDHILKLPFTWVGFDEASALKNPETAQTKAAVRVADKTSRVLAITATPIQSKLEEYHSILSVVDPALLGSRESFEQRFCKVEAYTIDKTYYEIVVRKIVGYKNLPQFKSLIQNHVLQRDIEDVGAQLPELIIQDRWLQLTKEQRARYEDIEAGIFLLEPGGKVNIIEAGQQVMRLRQICDANQLIWPSNDPSAKINEIEDLLRSELRGDQVVIFSQFTSMLDEVRDRVLIPLNISYGTVVGGQSMAETNRFRQEFQNGSRQVMLMSTAGEQGLNLGAGRYLICCDLLYNEGRMQQLYARIRRLSSSHPQAIIIRLLCRDTIEERILKLLESRSALIEYLDTPDQLGALEMRDIMRLVNRRVSLLD